MMKLLMRDEGVVWRLVPMTNCVDASDVQMKMHFRMTEIARTAKLTIEIVIS